MAWQSIFFLFMFDWLIAKSVTTRNFTAVHLNMLQLQIMFNEIMRKTQSLVLQNLH